MIGFDRNQSRISPVDELGPKKDKAQPRAFFGPNSSAPRGEMPEERSDDQQT